MIQRDTDLESAGGYKPVGKVIGIEAYRYAGCWAFNNPEFGLVNELFVGGSDTFIDKFAGEANKVSIQFSILPFPGHTAQVNYVEGEKDFGTTYKSEDGHMLWLCGVLGMYFQETPKTIFVNIKPIL